MNEELKKELQAGLDDITAAQSSFPYETEYLPEGIKTLVHASLECAKVFYLVMARSALGGANVSAFVKEFDKLTFGEEDCNGEETNGNE